MKQLLVLAIAITAQMANAADNLEKWKLDPGHAAVVFKINHLGFSHVYGMFSDVSGNLNLDEKGDKSSLELEIKTASVTTVNPKRDEHLNKADFFDSKQFPLITFKSDSIKKSGNNYEVKGKLSMHGKTNPVTFKLSRNNTGKDPWGGIRTGGDATFKIKRSEFGMSYMNGPNGIGDDVELMISMEATKI